MIFTTYKYNKSYRRRVYNGINFLITLCMVGTTVAMLAKKDFIKCAICCIATALVSIIMPTGREIDSALDKKAEIKRREAKKEKGE